MPVSPLRRLPVELHLGIISKLELWDTANLACVNRYFRSIIAPPSHADYLAAEVDVWAQNRGLYACSNCASFCRFQDFADDMKKGKHIRGGAEAGVRLCLRCGVTRGLYVRGATVVIYGKPHVLCRFCESFTDRQTYQAVCTKCCPRTPPSSTSSSPYMMDYTYTNERASSRSARVYYDRTHTDEFYGGWSDS
ncbi:hypothetical protein BDU57DRAFT_438338 [Ampelomyces quisqualis]|uniref:F-box domain-containing protein n=1 Tax=Ampelomyces quisqualis TaxID=50730 RepID=A0A6A5R3T3_AMPQU|nr:hypothetical protein BDU57DRAFT_438338 [Ampelomyces quisqualis]